MAKRINPGPAGTGRGAKVRSLAATSLIERAKYKPAQFMPRLLPPPSDAVGYYLHVNDLGRELRFPFGRPPGLPYLTVHVRDDFEFTRTINLFEDPIYHLGKLPVLPRGEGWRWHDEDTNIQWTEWRRPVRR